MTPRTAVILGLAVLLTYGNSLSGSYHWDDVHSIIENPHIRSLANIPQFFVDPARFSYDPDKAMYRPLLLVTYALNYAVGGYDVTGWHLVNVGLHVANTCLVAGLGSGLGLPGLWAGLLFAVHPLCSEAVNYISARSDSLCALFVLLTLALYVKGSRWSWLAFAAALLSKEWAVVVPGILWLTDRYRGWIQVRTLRYIPGTVYMSAEGNRRWLVRYAHWWYLGDYLPYLVLTGGYVAILVITGFLGGALGHMVRPMGEQLGLQMQALVTYVRLFVAPVGLSIEPLALPGLQVPLWGVGAMFLLLAIAGSVLWLGRRHPWHWAVCASGLTLLPTLLVPLNVVIAERRWYLVVGFLALGLSPWLAQWKRVAVPVLVTFSLLTMLRNRDWHDELSLWSAAPPAQPRVQLYLGNAHAARALAGEDPAVHWAAARTAYSHAYALDPHGELALRAWHNLGSVRWSTGDVAGAVRAYVEVLSVSPGFVDAWINLGQIMESAGDTARSRECYVRAQSYAKYVIAKPTRGPWR